MKTEKEINAYAQQIGKEYVAAKARVWTVINSGKPGTASYEQDLHQARSKAGEFYGILRGLCFVLGDSMLYKLDELDEQVAQARAEIDAAHS